MNSGVPSQLRWACRRGMLELDVLLGHFLEEAYLQLSSADQMIFMRLLDCNDQELFDWFMQKKQPPSRELAKMVDSIRLHAQTR